MLLKNNIFSGNLQMNIYIKPHNEDYFSVQFINGYNQQLLDCVRSLPQRKWNNEEKLWLIPDNQQAMDQLLQNIFDIGLFNMPQNDLDIIPTSENHDSSITCEIKKLNEALTVRHYSDHTKQCYRKWVKEFLQIHKDNISTIGEVQINEFLKDLALKKHVSASTQNQALAALLFYFRYIQNTPVMELGSVIHAKKKERVPVVFSRDEVTRVIECMPRDIDLRVADMEQAVEDIFELGHILHLVQKDEISPRIGDPGLHIGQHRVRIAQSRIGPVIQRHLNDVRFIDADRCKVFAEQLEQQIGFAAPAYAGNDLDHAVADPPLEFLQINVACYSHSSIPVLWQVFQFLGIT